MADVRYSPQLLEAFRAPQHAGPLAEGPGEVVDGAAGEQRRGTAVRFALRLDRGLVCAVAWGAYGSPYVLAGCELAARDLQGKRPDALQAMSARALAAGLAAPADRLGELLVVEDALRNCWLAWENRRL